MTTIDLSVVIPVYNNAATLDELLDRLIAVLEKITPAFEILPVDDGSTDHSLALLQRRALREPRIRPLALTRNFGGQSAVCAGFDAVRGARTVCLDADLENEPEDVPALLGALDAGADLACGVRELRQTGLGRRIPSALMNAYARSRMRITVNDIGCGMRAMDSRLVRDLASEGEKRRFLTPLLIERATRVVEVPVRHSRPGAPGGHSFLSLFAIAGDFFLITAGRPFHVTGLLSLSLGGLGFLGALLGLQTERPLLALAGWMSALAGAVGAIASLVGEYAQRIYEFSQNRPYYRLRELPPPAEASSVGPTGGAHDSPDAGRRSG